METVVAFFFFKQKTAYEVRISDWSSDVCSSDLLVDQHGERRARPSEQHDAGDQRDAFLPDGADTQEPDMAVRANEDFMVLNQRRDALAQIAPARCFRRQVATPSCLFWWALPPVLSPPYQEGATQGQLNME